VKYIERESINTESFKFNYKTIYAVKQLNINKIQKFLKFKI